MSFSVLHPVLKSLTSLISVLASTMSALFTHIPKLTQPFDHTHNPQLTLQPHTHSLKESLTHSCLTLSLLALTIAHSHLETFSDAKAWRSPAKSRWQSDVQFAIDLAAKGLESIAFGK